MKRIIIATLAMCILTAVASAQLLERNKTKEDFSFSQWRSGIENTLYFDWQKQFEKIKAKQAREKAAIDKAYAAIPEKAKTKAEIKWINDYNTPRGVESYWETNTCSVILLDYNEKNGLGTVNAAFKNDCFKLAREEALRGWFTFSISLYKFEKEFQQERFIYEYDGSVEADLKPFKHIKINEADYYQFAMPARTPDLQAGLRKLFPNKKSFITAEQASLALKKMPGHSRVTLHGWSY